MTENKPDTLSSDHLLGPVLSLLWMAATVSGIIVLENPTPVPGGGSCLSFTGAMWITGSITLRGLYRYFNTYNETFNHVSKHYAEVHVAKFVPCRNPAIEPTVSEICDDEKDLKDFYVAADIIRLIPLGTEDPRQKLFVRATAAALNCQKDDGSFELVPTQYISYFKSNPSLSHFPIHASFNPVKYKGKKPTPNNNTTVTVEGFLTDVVKDDNKHASHFLMSVDNIVFPARVAGTSSSTTAHKGNSDNPSDRFTFSFDDIDTDTTQQSGTSSFSAVKLSPPAELETSTRLGKRKK